MADQTKIVIRNDLGEFPELTRKVHGVLEPRGFSGKPVYVVDLALEEMVTNIIKYGYDDQDEHQIEIILNTSDAGVELKIIDDGHFFNPLETETADTVSDLDSRAVGGVGIHLTCTMADEVDYRRRHHKNILTVKVSRKS